jgi:hypothetical protein
MISRRTAAAALAAVVLALLASGSTAGEDEDETVWPNAKSRACSDPWLVEHHDEIRQMKPRVLVLNFVADLSHDEAARKFDALRAALKESSRWRGYDDPAAPAFLDYQVAKQVDLTGDPAKAAADGNSSLYPRVKDWKEGLNFDYARLYSDEFAELYGFEDPAKKGAFLTLGKLVDRGLVHEVWFLAMQKDLGAPCEAVEEKQVYDERFVAKPGQHCEAGNGGDPAHTWTGRSLRILFMNAERGCGCAMESLGHALEHTATSGAIPYFSRYFVEYAMLDLDKRFGLPFDSLYARGPDPVSYPTPTTLAYKRDGRERKLEGYVVAGGNVHFPPNARRDYDMENEQPVLSTIEGWRQRAGAGGKDAAAPWTPKAIAPFRDLAPDCMGPWVVYWRQNMPGLDNKARDDDGKPMKNWWPFLFY